MFKKRTVKHQNGTKPDKRILLTPDSDEQKQQQQLIPAEETENETIWSVKKRRKLTNPIKTSLKKEDLKESEKKAKEVHVEQLNNNIKEIRVTNNKRLPTIKDKILVDYQPDVCKDFKETGFCGYGDSCKFLHSRDDYIKGLGNATFTTTKWNSDIMTHKKIKNIDDKSIDQKDIVPFKCIICKQKYESPIETNCGHSFCKKCFLNTIQGNDNQKCLICGKDTQGIMKPLRKGHVFKKIPKC
ncbi:U2-type spliceosomal complex subunit CWC24 SCDLUD_001465 [Saccharomycodes ludwigii]|uniref:U2-type spliceosomal complex subunit CWC24 n=1 Tax=Saccharomycodes ludwigii TaxID=36035 RepID=UPI001E86FBEE|nr:hypothetical protein SCDLUD_001465 [Saccharomycodes ludwigii]KAH3901694.1 hypothetical protein SCDLUD_001465 [Saccharomycodes ludwigii]